MKRVLTVEIEFDSDMSFGTVRDCADCVLANWNAAYKGAQP